MSSKGSENRSVPNSSRAYTRFRKKDSLSLFNIGLVGVCFRLFICLEQFPLLSHHCHTFFTCVVCLVFLFWTSRIGPNFPRRQLLAVKKRSVLRQRTLANDVIPYGRLPLPGIKSVRFYMAWWSSCVLVSTHCPNGSDETTSDSTAFLAGAVSAR